MDELVRWFGEQLNEDERIARRVESSWRQIGETGVIVASDGNRAEECANGNWTGVAEHIVQHDPARVLREIDAKRQTLAQCQAAEERMDGAMRANDTGVYQAARAEARALHAVLRRDAAVYADRPGYREEWRP